MLYYMSMQLNSLALGRFEWNFRNAIFKLIVMIDGWGISCEIALIWMWTDFTDDHSTLVQVMAWCHQATSHYLSQCWPRSLLPYGITRLQLVKKFQLLQTLWKLSSIKSGTWHGSCAPGLMELQYSVNSLAPGRCGSNFKRAISKHVTILVHVHYLWNCSQVDATEHLWWQVNIASGNGLVPSGSKPLPEPMLTWIYVTIWRH